MATTTTMIMTPVMSPAMDTPMDALPSRLVPVGLDTIVLHATTVKHTDQT